MLDPVCDDAQRKRADHGRGLLPGRAERHHPRKYWNVRDPAAIHFPFEFDFKFQRHSSIFRALSMAILFTIFDETPGRVFP